MKKIASYVITIFGSVVLSLAIQQWLTPKSIKAFDAKESIDSYQSAIEQKGASNERQVQLLGRFVEVMNQVTNEYAQEHNVVIVVSAAHVSGADDITNEIQQLIVERYKEQ